jgi:hypothetical protein
MIQFARFHAAKRAAKNELVARFGKRSHRLKAQG